MGERARIGILLGSKGRGSNALSIARACKEGHINALVSVFISPVEASDFMTEAVKLGLHTGVVPPGAQYPERLLRAVQGCEWLCLAGYLRLLPSEVLDKFNDKILNIHPSLLPKYGGRGMFGMHVHQAVILAGETVSGCTVHHVNEVYDAGEIVCQRTCPVLPGDSPETLARRVLAEEHLAYIEALKQLLPTP